MLTLESPAKINLFLKILNRRLDGYHEIASLFQAIDLCDIMTFCLSGVDRLTCSDPHLKTDQTNLVNKALELFRKKTGIQHPVAIDLIKKIPQQAGLGGGSSNAATTLWAMNQLYGQPTTETQLINWGAEIGSDVAFFLSKGTAYCTGRGEILKELPPLPKTAVLIVKPLQSLSTPLIYKALNVKDLVKHAPDMMLSQFIAGQPMYINDLEIPAFKVMPQLADLKNDLMELGFSTVLMSGSGSSFFCLGKGKMPIDPELSCFNSSFINRVENNWFKS